MTTQRRVSRTTVQGRAVVSCKNSEGVINMSESVRELVTQMTNKQLFAVWFLIGAALVFWMQAGFAMC